MQANRMNKAVGCCSVPSGSRGAHLSSGRAAAGFAASPCRLQPLHARCIAFGLKENVAQLASVEQVKQVVVGGGTSPWVIPNAPGKKASVAIYSHLATKYGGELTPEAAQEGLQLYGEYMEEAQQQPGSHPNIDILLEVVQQGSTRPLTVE